MSFFEISLNSYGYQIAFNDIRNVIISILITISITSLKTDINAKNND